jgi:hypothetical protein
MNIFNKRRLNLQIIHRSLFIRTEQTPNPHSLKFLPDMQVLPNNMGTGPPTYLLSSS